MKGEIRPARAPSRRIGKISSSDIAEGAEGFAPDCDIKHPCEVRTEFGSKFINFLLGVFISDSSIPHVFTSDPHRNDAINRDKHGTFMDLTQYDGKPLQQLVDDAVVKIDEAHREIVEAIKMLRLVVSQAIPEHQRGKVRQRLWQAEKAVGMHPLYTSQAGQDRHLNETIFEGKRDGTFLDIGGFDGITGSNTYFFEKNHSWTGYLVEPAAVPAKNAKRIRTSPVIEKAVAGREGTAEFFCVDSGYTQMSGLADQMPDSIIESIRQHPTHRESNQFVSTITLHALFRSLNLTHVDLCCIDVEGAERGILENADWSSIDFHCLVVENAKATEETGMRDLIEPKGYRLDSVIGFDEIYVKDRSVPK